MKTKCLVVLSGGQDSSTCAFWAAEHYDEVHCATFDYGQRHAREIEAAKTIAKLVKAASHEIVTLGPILKGRSPLTNPDESLETYTDHASMEAIIGDRVETTFVPMRNALFLTLAANHAICRGIYDVVTGVCQSDNANYPDCRETFIKAQGRAIVKALGLDRIAGGPKFWIHTPLMNLSKAESVHMAYNLSETAYAALAFSHTAYDGLYPPVGKDHASVLRAHGFLEAGLPDPLVIRAWNEGWMALPDTSNYVNMEFNAALASTIQILAEGIGYGK